MAVVAVVAVVAVIAVVAVVAVDTVVTATATAVAKLQLIDNVLENLCIKSLCYCPANCVLVYTLICLL